MKIKEFIDYEQPNDYIVSSDLYNNEYKTPVITAGQSFILGYTNENGGIYNKGPCAIFDDFTTSVHYVDFPFKVKSSAMKILTTKSDADLKYCYYLLLNLSNMPPNHKRQWISTTSEKNHLLPSIDKQKGIVNQLDLISKTINNYTNQIKDLDTLVKARFVEMFGDPIINKNNFKIKKLSEACPFNKYNGEIQSFDGKYWLLNLDALESNTGEIIEKKYQSLNEIGDSTIKFSGNCVLYSKLRPYLNKVVVPDISGYGTSELICMQTGEEVNSQYLAALLRSDSFVNYINSKTAGAKMPRVSMNDLRDFKLMVPPAGFQQQFADFVQQIDKSKYVDIECKIDI